MPLRLSQLLDYDDVVIQCHDNPDADAIASGYALWKYFKYKGRDARFVYSGKFKINKSNLVKMVDSLDINLEYVEEIDNPDLLVTVDCQYGESNVTKFDVPEVAVIDHHQISGSLPELSMVRCNYGSCSTVIWEMLKDEGMDVNSDIELATALYYGLYTDTNAFTEISRPEDKDLRDDADFRSSLITLYRNSNLSMEELRIAGKALEEAKKIDKYKYALCETQPCDPNILGVISDMLLEVDSVETCLVYSVLEFGVKISVRSCITSVQANELAAYICEGLGGGGGHLIKAGGFLKKDLIEKNGYDFTQDTIRKLLNDRMNGYFENSVVLYAGEHKEDVSKLKVYVKKSIKLGYVVSTDLAPKGSKITVRTLEGDVDILTGDDTYIVLGINGEIYPINREKFERGYDYLDEPYEFMHEYNPSVLESVSGERVCILPFAKSCIANGGVKIYARQITKRKKVFTAWDPEHYYLGKPGDYLATRMDDLSDIYIIDQEIFKLTYEEDK